MNLITLCITNNYVGKIRGLNQQKGSKKENKIYEDVNTQQCQNIKNEDDTRNKYNYNLKKYLNKSLKQSLDTKFYILNKWVVDNHSQNIIFTLFIRSIKNKEMAKWAQIFKKQNSVEKRSDFHVLFSNAHSNIIKKNSF